VAAFVGCKHFRGQILDGPGMERDSAVYDSIVVAGNDTTPPPMFLIGGDSKYRHLLYWANIEEPQKDDDNAEYFEAWHNSWALQEMFRRNAAQYTNLIQGDKIVKVKFVDELLKDPDGNTPSIGEIHGREEIPALCARFDFADPKDNNAEDATWGIVVCTDSYLNSRKRLDIKPASDNGNYPKLPADIVKQIEKEYGMKALKTAKLATIGNRYIHGTIEFEGEYKNAPKDPYDTDRKYALALEVIVDSGKIYKLEELGYYDPSYGSSWNADADGYLSNDIVAAFEGPSGLELCYTHSAPESYCIGMIYLRDGKLIERQYEMFHSLIDEETPVWQRDFAEMRKLYYDDEMGDRNVDLVKWAHCYIDYDNEWIWLRDKDDENGAFFIRKDGKFQLIAVENRNYRPAQAEKNGTCYLWLEGPAGGPSWVHEIIAFKNGKQIEKFNCLQIEGKIDECSLNNKELSKEQGQAYLDKLPESREITAYFRDIKE
jgi:hypothetical protein